MVYRTKRQEFAVIGLGRFGSSLALALEQNGHTVLGIDIDSDIVQALADRLTQVVVLDATNEDALKEVDIAAFDTVVVAIGTDFENNLLITVALKTLGVPTVISKVIEERQRRILLRVGADRVVQPEVEAGQRLATELMAPAVLEQLSLGPEHSVMEMVVPAPFIWKSLRQCEIRTRYQVTVLAVKREGMLEVTPTADFIFHENDLLLLLGNNKAIADFYKLT